MLRAAADPNFQVQELQSLVYQPPIVDNFTKVTEWESKTLATVGMPRSHQLLQVSFDSLARTIPAVLSAHSPDRWQTPAGIVASVKTRLD